MFKSAGTSLILLGILAIVAGVVAIAWPGVSQILVGVNLRGAGKLFGATS